MLNCTCLGTAAFDHRVRRSVLREGLNLIGICMSMVVAGSGELNCLQRLRAAYAQHIQPIRYGTYMATHLGIGLLFLGGGRYTLGTSDAAIACMIAAFYPRFNLSSADNKSYLQALRHLWVLAAEPRLLVTRDVDTQEVVNVYAKILKQDSPSAQPEMLHVYAPKMMPDIDSIKAIKLESPRYWPVYLDISKHPHLHASILRSQTVWIKRRSAFLPYMDDRKGARSLMVRSPSTTANAAALEVPTSANADPEEDLNVIPLLPLYTTDPLFLATADHLCEDEEDATEAERVFSTFCRAALLDALCQDKSHVLQAHLQLFRIRTMPMRSRSFLLRAQDVRFCSAFYHTVFEERFSGRPENNFRPALMRLGTIAGTFLDLDRRFDSIREHPAFLRALGNYVRGEAVEIGGELLPGGVTPDRALSWYLLRESVPPVTILLALRSLSEAARAQCSQGEGVNGTQDMDVLEQSIRRVIHDASIRLTGRNGIWGERSLQEVVALWGEST
jgi:anaphase-promoting complex subunit 1